MNGYAEEHKISSEEAGRQLRYKVFEETLERQKQGEEHCKIAVAADNCFLSFLSEVYY